MRLAGRDERVLDADVDLGTCWRAEPRATTPRQLGGLRDLGHADAVQRGDELIVSLLLAAGAKQQKDTSCITPLLEAALNARPFLIPLLLDGVSAQEEWDAWKILGKLYNISTVRPR